MRILLTNDDGVNAPGLKVLEKIAREFSDDIWIVAPAEENSGAGHSLTLTRPVRIRQHGHQHFSVTGTPDRFGDDGAGRGHEGCETRCDPFRRQSRGQSGR
jgi:5'/3'-nucleotidase SurE